MKNLQGDIVGIVDSNGTEVVKYSYDVWGLPMFATEGSMASTLGKSNPLRYRGYVYDEVAVSRGREHSPRRFQTLSGVLPLVHRGYTKRK